MAWDKLIYTDSGIRYSRQHNPCQVPGIVAFFPLNGTYGTKEINSRTAQGVSNSVKLSEGPLGQINGSYEFEGTSTNYMEFPNSPGGPLDVRYSITIVCWLYFDGKNGPLFNYGISSYGVHFWVAEEELFFRLQRRADRSNTGILKHTVLTKSWKFVGASYNQTSGEMKSWVDGSVHTLNVGAGLELATQDRIRVGATDVDQRYFKGRITQLQIYNRTLTPEEIQAIRNQVAGKDRSFAYDIRLLESGETQMFIEVKEQPFYQV